MSAVPKLRFPEFDGGWIAKKLSSVAKVRGGFAFKSSDFSESGIPVVRISNLIAETGFVDVSFAVKHPEIKNAKNYIIQRGDILIALSGATTGKSCVYEESFTSYLNQRVGKFELISKSADYSFLRKLVFSDKFKGQLDSVLVAGAQPNIAPKDIENFEFAFPSLPEQQKIASFLSSLDKKIDLLRQKKDALELYKKGLMQKIFSQEIRFKQDDGSDFPDWEEVALGDVLDYEQPTKYIVNSTDYSSEHKTPVLTAGKSFILGFTDEDFGIFSENLPVIIFDDFATSSKFVDFPFKVKSSAMKILKTKRSGDKLSLIHEMIKEIRYTAENHQRHWISIFSAFNVQMPSQEEQQKIASLLSSLDAKIQKTSSQIEQMETFKKGLLQQMFV